VPDINWLIEAGVFADLIAVAGDPLADDLIQHLMELEPHVSQVMACLARALRPLKISHCYTKRGVQGEELTDIRLPICQCL